MTVLLGLMFKYASEHSQVIICGDYGYQQVELESGTILKNMEHVMAMQKVSAMLGATQSLRMMCLRGHLSISMSSIRPKKHWRGGKR